MESQSKNIVNLNASGKKGMLSCCKCLFQKIAANVTRIQADNVLKTVQKNAVLAEI